MTSILNDVHKGMRVRDAGGTEIGTVEFVHLTDEDPSRPGPETVTVDPAMRREGHSWLDFVTDAFQADDLPQPLRDRLLRNGFVRIDADGLFAADRYVMPEQIASVSGEGVALAVSKDELLKRGS